MTMDMFNSSGTDADKGMESLSSDAQLEEAETLLLEAQAQSKTLSVFTSTDILNLAENLSILEYEAGEVVMQQGEHASWVGIVLRRSRYIVRDPRHGW